MEHGFDKQVGKWFYCKCGLRFLSRQALNKHIQHYQTPIEEIKIKPPTLQELKLIEVSTLEDLEKLQPGALVSIPVELLKPHPKAITIPMSEEDEKALKESIKERGVLDPLHINPKGIILDGVHRWKYARELAIKKVPAKLFKYEFEEEEILHALEINLKRRQLTKSQKATLSLDLLEIEEKLAEKRRKATLPKKGQKGFQPMLAQDCANIKGKASEIVAKRVGVGTRTLEMVKKAVEVDPSLKEPLLKGEISAEEAYRRAKQKERLSKLSGEDDDEAIMVKLGIPIKPYDVWFFSRRDERFGKPVPGAIPAQIVFNLLYFYTKPGDLIVDPMAGGGVVGDVCKVMKRRCLMYDINPTRPDIKKHDLRNGLPKEAWNADLVFLDPPYYKKLEDKLGAESISSLSYEEYINFFDKLAKDLIKANVKKVALLISDYVSEGEKPGTERAKDIFIWDYVWIFKKAGWKPIRHIDCPLTTQQLTPVDMERLRKSRRLASLRRSLIIFKRGKEGG